MIGARYGSSRGRRERSGRPLGDAGTGRLRYLDTATRRIARGLSVDETLAELCRAAVPLFADLAVVHLYDPLPLDDGPPESPPQLKLHTVYRTPAPTAETPSHVLSGPLAKLLRAGRPVFANGPGCVAAATELLASADLAEEAPPGRRMIIAPLRGRHHVLGSLALLRDRSRHAYTADDLLVASQLATHAALGVDKALLHGQEASVADTLQRTMLPPSLPALVGVRLASRYLPASRTAEVGGDWYDAISLPGNRVALVIGDVMGHSLTSAAIMGQLRTVVQTLAGLDLPPHEVLHHLDEQAGRLGSQHLATCLYAVYDPVSRRLLTANAGHPPPLLLHRDGSAEILTLPSGVPIGVGGGDFETTEMPAPTGSTLLLYTDGLVESRGSDIQSGMTRLRHRLRALGTDGSPSLEPLCEAALGTLEEGDRADDVALLAARFEGLRPETAANWYLTPHPRTASQARRLARRTLNRWGLDPLTDTTELLVTEVVANAVRVTTRPLTLRLLRTDVLRVEVRDDSPQLPRLGHARLDDENGRGLFLVDQLALRWGVTRVSGGKIVWFEQRLPGPVPGRLPRRV
ncbi:SpoIIE family protein phosphatase [Streptomyces sp. NPDC005017]|uniref:ATP-binding SpoIIE family protein phosphatase n=1 Tax=Streptomyces sp. NPDC005017 TaxID=3364706 RepID=UPI0036ABA42D